MEQITRQVANVQRRLTLQKFLAVLKWTLGGAMLLALVALAVPKIWALPATETPTGWSIWAASWIGGAIAAGLLGAGLWTWLKRGSSLDAAMEIDRRFGLKERVSSALALGPIDRESELGQALVSDAERRVERLEIGEKFGYAFDWKALLPLAPIAALVLFFFLPNRLPQGGAIGNETTPEVRKRIIEQNKELQKKIAEQRKKLEEKGLHDAEAQLKQLEERLDQISKDGQIDRNKALVQLNDLKKEVEKKRQEAGGAEKLREQLKQLKPAGQGPAEKVAQAMKQGDFKKAMEEIKDLQAKLNNGELNDQEKEKLAEQLDDMKKKLEELAKAHEQAKQDLQQQIDQAQRNGDQAQADKLQQQLDQLQMQDEQMEQVQQMAQNLGDCQKCLAEGNGQQAAQKLDQLGQQLQEMQNQLDQMEAFDEVAEQIGQCKNGMCDKPGEGKPGQGMAQNGEVKDGPPKNGLGAGRGQGDRPEEATDTGSIDSQVRGKTRPGEAIRTGDADGPNIAGRSQESVREAIESAGGEETDPLTSQRLPRNVREHAREYFQSLGQGK
ncbi:hypothetical protein [Lignipirellula cremea]|uniref:Chromosome partition protein Smc n=1 Tax=Lignipirellula cremea TaxID=2528010 RepID=A0A518DMD4_9BACT|nr:hypothetical protein [Lignipirellula cremea]QDU92994.1 hypothetical protein Pla8534_07690 [Lignipirellula cremea]